MQEQQFVVSVGDGFSSSDIIVPSFQAFSSDSLSANANLEGTVGGMIHSERVYWIVIKSESLISPFSSFTIFSGDKLVHTGGVITHTLLADASGTITLPASLTQV